MNLVILQHSKLKLAPLMVALLTVGPHLQAQDLPPQAPSAVVDVTTGVHSPQGPEIPIPVADGTTQHTVLVSSPDGAGGMDTSVALYSKEAQQMGVREHVRARLDSIASTYDKLDKQVRTRKIPYAVMTIFTVFGTFTWLWAAPFSLPKKAVIMSYQVGLQNFLFFNPEFWNKAVHVQTTGLNWALRLPWLSRTLKKLGAGHELSDWNPFVRAPAILVVSTTLGTVNRLVNNFDKFSSEITNGSQFLKDLYGASGWVVSNFPWDHFSGRLKAEAHPQTHKFFSYYNQVRWIAVVLGFMAAHQFGGENVAMGLLFTHGTIGVLANLNFEKVVNYLEQWKIGDRVEGALGRLKERALAAKTDIGWSRQPVICRMHLSD